jgi:cell division GTPase FtsZ
MELEQLEQIFEDTESKWEGDNAFQGLQILSKYTDNLIQAAEHDIIYSVSITEIIDKLTEEDAIKLAELNWMLDDVECFACFV